MGFDHDSVAASSQSYPHPHSPVYSSKDKVIDSV